MSEREPAIAVEGFRQPDAPTGALLCSTVGAPRGLTSWGFVLERQGNPSPKRRDFSVFDFHIHFHYLSDYPKHLTQPTMSSRATLEECRSQPRAFTPKGLARKEGPEVMPPSRGRPRDRQSPKTQKSV